MFFKSDFFDCILATSPSFPVWTPLGVHALDVIPTPTKTTLHLSAGVDFPGGSRWSSWIGGCPLFSPCWSNVHQGIALERMIKTSFTTFWGGFDLRCRNADVCCSFLVMVSWWCLDIYFIEVHENRWISSYLSDTFHWNKWICWAYHHGHTYLCYPPAHTGMMEITFSKGNTSTKFYKYFFRYPWK